MEQGLWDKISKLRTILSQQQRRLRHCWVVSKPGWYYSSAITFRNIASCLNDIAYSGLQEANASRCCVQGFQGPPSSGSSVLTYIPLPSSVFGKTFANVKALHFSETIGIAQKQPTRQFLFLTGFYLRINTKKSSFHSLFEALAHKSETLASTEPEAGLKLGRKARKSKGTRVLNQESRNL